MGQLPQYPLSPDEQAAAASPPETGEQDQQPLAGTGPLIKEKLPTQMSFAQDVRAERLAMLWKVTLFSAFILWWVVFVISGGREVSLFKFMLPTIVVSLGCLLAGQLLNRDRFREAVWAYAMGAVFAIGILMIGNSTFSENYTPFIFPLLVFVVGLLLPVRDTLTLLLVVAGVAIILPSVDQGALVLRQSTFFALCLTGLATGLSAQVSGELFAIAEWALENYRKERQTTGALFESREALQKSFLRQTALTHEVQKANAQLEEARRAAEEAKAFRGQFLANMSHELRTPLNAIIGFSQTMLDFPAMYDGVELPPEYRQDMNQILTSGQHLLSIINDILDLSKVDAGKLELEIQPVDLGPIIKGVMSTAVGLVGGKKDKVKLTKNTPDPLPTVMGDPLRVRQVLLNFYSNAAKFTEVGHVKLIITVEGDEVIFAVEDTGCGITEADRATIFEEFRQGTVGRKKGRQGAGLGLAISQQLIRLMHGRLWFESVVGKGSTFYFALPLHVPTPAEAPTDTGEAPAGEATAEKTVAEEATSQAAPQPADVS